MKNINYFVLYQEVGEYMIVLQTQELSKSFGNNQIFKELDLVVKEKERIGLVGVNGSGKTTLLKCLTGKLEPDSGKINISASTVLGCLEQIPDNMPETTAWESVMQSFSNLLEMRQLMNELEMQMTEPGANLEKIMERYARVSEEYDRANGYACENTARRILVGLGFESEDFDKRVDNFSGGQKTRLNLGRLLAMAPDILLLDEPTNHLDMAAVEWLEDFIRNYSGTVLFVSHDRMFLDKIATRIVELCGGQLRSYQGNYSTYLHKKNDEEQAMQRAYNKQQEYIQNTEEYIRRFKAGIKSKQARGRQSQLDRLERIEIPEKERSIKNNVIRLKRESGRDVLSIDGVSKSYNDHAVLHDINLKVKKKEKIALIGPNGCGKTTLLKLISASEKLDKGEINLGSRVDMAYFSQEYEDLVPENNVLEEILDNFDIKIEDARTVLGSILFTGDDVFKKVKDLSGGEKGRLSFLKLLLSGANFLLMDEPTNHLDIESRQVVENMLSAFEGTVILVSHDRYFIDQVADRVAAIVDGKIDYYWGNYSYYYEKMQENKKIKEEEKRNIQRKVIEPEKQIRLEQKERQKTRKKILNEIEDLEFNISEMEMKKSDLEQLLSNPEIYSEEDKARKYNEEYRENEQKLLEALQDWELLNEELDQVK